MAGSLHELERHHSIHDGEIVALDARFDPTGRLLVTCGFDHRLLIHDVVSGQRIGQIYTGGFPTAIALDAKGSRVVVSRVPGMAGRGPSTTLIFRLGDVPLPVELVAERRKFVGHRAIPTADQRYVYTVSGYSARKFELASGKLEFALRDSVRRPTCVALRRGERELAIGYASGLLKIVKRRDG